MAGGSAARSLGANTGRGKGAEEPEGKHGHRNGLCDRQQSLKAKPDS